MKNIPFFFRFSMVLCCLIISSCSLEDESAKSDFHEIELIERSSARNQTPERMKSLPGCGDLIIDVRRTEDEGDCCVYLFHIEHRNTNTGGQLGWGADVYLDGEAYRKSSNYNSGGYGFPVRLCDGPQLLEIYSDGELCYSELLTCETECCIDNYTTFSSWEEDECCVFEYTFFGSGCGVRSFKLRWNSDVGPPDYETFITANGGYGIRVKICDPNQRFKILAHDDQVLCDYTPWMTSTYCLK